MRKPELLAPAGSKEAFIAAVENGADAVYFGGTSFSARQYASNFTREGLEWAIDYAHIKGVRAYITVNTLIKDAELEKACEYLQFLCNCGADAVIVQDLGLMQMLREQLPELPVHASTQMTIHNIEGVKFLQNMGVKRIVLGRELSLEDIRIIKSQTEVQIEAFIHGALCFSYSGQCLLSSMIGGRSGNRGYCAQPCRKKYRINGIEGCLLSPKDLNMSEHIPALVGAGIDSFKIEGRMKRSEYVAGVVRVYRKLIDRYFEAPEDFQVSEEEQRTLLQLFNRDFTTGYFFGNPGSELISRQPHNCGTMLGRVVKPHKKSMSIYLEAQLNIEDGISAGEDAGIIVRSMYLNNQSVSTAAPGSVVKIPFDNKVSAGDAVFKTYDRLLMASLETKNSRKIPIKMSVKAHVDEHAELRINDGENEIAIRGMSVSRAESKPLSRTSIEAQLKKLGGTAFEAHEIMFEIDDDIFIPLSELNSLRREAIAQLEGVRVQKWKRDCSKPKISPGNIKPKSKPILSVNTSSLECLEAAVDSGADVIYIGELEKEDYSCAIEYGRRKGVSVFISTPRIIKDIMNLNMYLDLNPDGFLVANPGVLHNLHRLSVPVVLDYPFNVFNRLTMEHLLNYSQRITLSPELTLEEIRRLTPFGPTECIVHGVFPLMVSEHDLISDLLPYGKLKEVLLKDEKGFAFPVRIDSQHRTYIMNSRQLCMLEYIPDLIKAGINCLRIEAKTYDKKCTGRITKAYRDALDGCDSIFIRKGEYTTGHYFRGVI